MTKVVRFQPKPPPVLPKPQVRLEVPDAEDWAAWCEHPITRFVAACLQLSAEKQREAWLAQSWGSAQADAAALVEYRTRADAYMAFLETPLEKYAELIQTP